VRASGHTQIAHIKWASGSKARTRVAQTQSKSLSFSTYMPTNPQVSYFQQLQKRARKSNHFHTYAKNGGRGSVPDSTILPHLSPVFLVPFSSHSGSVSARYSVGLERARSVPPVRSASCAFGDSVRVSARGVVRFGSTLFAGVVFWGCGVEKLRANCRGLGGRRPDESELSPVGRYRHDRPPSLASSLPSAAPTAHGSLCELRLHSRGKVLLGAASRPDRLV
jgi:hypothetical protein